MPTTLAPIIDQSGDLNFKELTKLAKLYEFPDFAKQAELAEIVGPEHKQAHLYADIRAPYQFPCHTKAATFVSYAFFLEKQAQVNPKVRPLVQERLDKFAEYWGIKNTIKALRNRCSEINKEAEYSDSDYAIVWVSDEGHKERRYPLRNSLEVKSAAEWFSTYLPEIRAQFGFSDRQTIANKIIVKAAAYGADIGQHLDLLEKYAGRGVCNPHEAAKLIKDRVKAASKCSPQIAASMHKLASMAADRPTMFLDPASMTQLADTVDQFDRNHGLLNRYTDMIPAPEDVLFKATHTKTAEVVRDACSLVTGSVYDRNDFSKLSATDVQDLFGDEVVNAVCSGLNIDPTKMAEVAATFPRNEANMLEQLLAERGVVPMAKDASTHLGFTFSQLEMLAK